jgi:hypothetical protein
VWKYKLQYIFVDFGYMEREMTKRSRRGERSGNVSLAGFQS